MKPSLSLAIFASILPWALPSAQAQQDTRIRALAFQSGALTEVYVHDPAGSAMIGKVNLKSFLNHEFDILKTKGGPVVFTTKADPASVKVEEDVVGQCELPGKAGSTSVLLFMPEGDNPAHCKVTLVDSTAKSFPPGSFKVVNLSPWEVKIELEKKEFDIKAGETLVIKDPPVGENQASGMKATCLRDGNWEQFGSGFWPHPGEKRVIQIITENPVTKQPELRGVRDVAKP